ncbi:Hypothetical predicted protein [Xyrichtys novacula]|uniref:Uncharacterized protein n=1 Tax=Xyrichtys novacula TaxID=13765 RepID=A0AAV1FLW0_XYRNO|nr:Hypothetical predicted protein [Xyrichtys novacula]
MCVSCLLPIKAVSEDCARSFLRCLLLPPAIFLAALNIKTITSRARQRAASWTYASFSKKSQDRGAQQVRGETPLLESATWRTNSFSNQRSCFPFTVALHSTGPFMPLLPRRTEKQKSLLKSHISLSVCVLQAERNGCLSPRPLSCAVVLVPLCFVNLRGGTGSAGAKKEEKTNKVEVLTRIYKKDRRAESRTLFAAKKEEIRL